MSDLTAKWACHVCDVVISFRTTSSACTKYSKYCSEIDMSCTDPRRIIQGKMESTKMRNVPRKMFKTQKKNCKILGKNNSWMENFIFYAVYFLDFTGEINFVNLSRPIDTNGEKFAWLHIQKLILKGVFLALRFDMILIRTVKDVFWDQKE